MIELKENEIIVSAHAVKYHSVEYFDHYVLIHQNRRYRRIYNGYYFENTGTYIYVSNFCAHVFQHKKKIKQFIVNTYTKEWRRFNNICIIKHLVEYKNAVVNNSIEELKK